MKHIYVRKGRDNMCHIVVISGHPNLQESIANKSILQNLGQALDRIDIAYLDTLYPDYQIDEKVEQDRLKKADIIVLQYPLFWYGMPALLSRYVEQTFLHGFSHGSNGDKLHGKKLIVSFTSGAKEEVYDGRNQYRIDEFLPSIQATCKLCGLEFAGYVYTGGVSYQEHQDPLKCEAIEQKAKVHADKIVALIHTL